MTPPFPFAQSVHAAAILAAAAAIKPVVRKTPLTRHDGLSARYGCEVWLKREDLQVVRSYKLRGAFHMMQQLTAAQKEQGVVCASSGNHAQGFAYACQQLQVKGKIFMPVTTPSQKVRQTKWFGKDWIDVVLTGDTFDDCQEHATAYAKAHQLTFIPPFDHPAIICGQGTVGVELLEALKDPDFIFVPVGGGGLSAGLGTFVKSLRPQTRIIGVEPEGAPSMTAARKAGAPVTLDTIDRFVDGAAVKRVGDLTFSVCQEVLDDICLVHEGAVCATILRLYNEDAIVAEPAGALSIAALEQWQESIKGKKIVCIVSGSNNDIDRLPEIKERALQFEGLKRYFLVNFAQRPGALKTFVNEILGPTDDITRFEYMQKTNKEKGPALVGVEMQDREDYHKLIENLNRHQVDYTEINKDDQLFAYLI
jgi:threonine dehydratase